MSSWGMGWFGGGAQKRKNAPKDAILGLRQQLDMLQKREKHLENQINEQDAIARKNVSTNKNVAKAALRRKKQQERSLNETSGMISQLEQQIYSIESANINQETLLAMQKAGKAMKTIHGGLTMDKIDQTMDELREQHQLGQEISNAITSTPIGEPIDEDDLENELEGLEQEAMDERMLKSGTVPVDRLPSVSNGPLKGKEPAEEDEEEELRKLQAEMAM
ncbi:MAG: ESCRT-III subunit protein snf7 [Cirrosporium novae-zelandiae]|nr:MAG: ESCRT-III subunit protein snf7 [Cirrosporium novae-zelandiae]